MGRRRREGQSMVEYALILAFMVVLILGVATAIGLHVRSIHQTAASNIN